MDVTPQDFLRLILPPDGYLCAHVLDGDRHWQRFFTNVDDLWDFIRQQDELGRTVYHACASYQTTANRKQANAKGARSLWGDLDVGPDKTYQTARAALDALLDFCRSVSFPTPIVVRSGAGFHFYWPLVETLDPARWRALARRLQQLFDQHGLAVDRVRTADISSILRTPGSHNRKGGAALPVICGPLVGPYDLKNFSLLANVGNPTQGMNDSLTYVNKHGTRKNESLTARALNLYGETAPADAETVADRCAQLGRMRGKPSDYSEPVIYAAIGVLQHCAEPQGRNWFAPEWQDQVDKKFKQHEAADVGPTTCAHFQNINPKGCENCPHKGRITSPVQLGREVVGSEQQPSTKMQPSLGNGNGPAPADRPINGHHIEVPGFQNTSDGLFAYKENRGGELIPIKICAQPIFLRSVQHHEADRSRHSLVFDHVLASGTEEITIPSGTVFGAGGMSEFADQNIHIHDNDQFRRYIRDSVDIWNKTMPTETRYDQFGWKEDNTAFLVGSRLYRRDGVSRVTGSPEVVYRAGYLQPKTGGTLAAWSNAANQLFAQGLEAQSFGLLCGFGAPLMRFHTSTEGGAIAGFVSDHTGSGKTTVLESVQSIWGAPDGIKLSDEDTKIAKGLKLGIMGNLPCTYDELVSRDPMLIREFVVTFTNGKDKDRARPDGTLVHNRSEWQTILVLASNKPVFDILANIPGEADAHAYRVLEFVVEFKDKVDKRRGDQLRRDMQANAGWAGDYFARILVMPETQAFIKENLDKTMDMVYRRTGLNTDYRFWVRMITSVILAGTIVNRYGIVDFSIERIGSWVMEYAKELALTQVSRTAKRDQDVLSEFIVLNFPNILRVQHAYRANAPTPAETQPRVPLIRYEVQDKRMFISDTALREYLVKNNVHRIIFDRTLKEMGVITNISKYVTMGAGTGTPTGQIKCYEINLDHPAMDGVLRAVAPSPVSSAVAPAAASSAPTASA